MRWKPAASVVFTMKSAYKWWRSERMDTRVGYPKFSQIWKPKIPLKIKTGLQHTFASIDDVWAVGKAMKRAAMNSLEATISQAIILAGAWTIWCTRNEVIFRGARIYQENMQDMFKWRSRGGLVHGRGDANHRVTAGC
ncbi:hypothetical protein QJS10_CPB14g00919 [Acorus calamus]|uniref:Uncharacterized protein n=1 Tax=Acorus calamus TaxID=4465 RepID=A0AAV9DBR7_ACOCL|nr:hypothetical protein QJS10_CPB14g00919 [Acorus calamus]